MTHQNLTNTHPGQKGLQRSGEQLRDVVDEILTRALQLLVDVPLGVYEQLCHLGRALSTQNTRCTSPGLHSAMAAFLEVWATKIAASIEMALQLMNLYKFFWPWHPWPWSSWPHSRHPSRSWSFFMAARTIEKSATDVLMLDSAAVYSLWLSLCPGRYDLCWTLKPISSLLYISTCACTHTHMHAHAHTHLYTHPLVHTHTHTHPYTHTDKHTQRKQPQQNHNPHENIKCLPPTQTAEEHCCYSEQRAAISSASGNRQRLQQQQSP